MMLLSAHLTSDIGNALIYGVENDTCTVGDVDDNIVYSKELKMSSNTSGSEVWTGMLYCKES